MSESWNYSVNRYTEASFRTMTDSGMKQVTVYIYESRNIHPKDLLKNFSFRNKKVFMSYRIIYSTDSFKTLF